jgi:hypothetical protein
MENNQWQQWALAIAGASIFIAPWAFGSATGAIDPGGYVLWSHLVIGLAIFVLAIAALLDLQAWEEWTMVVFGIATVAMPWLMGFSQQSALTVADVILGVLVVGLAGWTAFNEAAGA